MFASLTIYSSVHANTETEYNNVIINFIHPIHTEPQLLSLYVYLLDTQALIYLMTVSNKSKHYQYTYIDVFFLAFKIIGLHHTGIHTQATKISGFAFISFCLHINNDEKKLLYKIALYVKLCVISALFYLLAHNKSEKEAYILICTCMHCHYKSAL